MFLLTVCGPFKLYNKFMILVAIDYHGNVFYKKKLYHDTFSDDFMGS